MLGFSLRNYGLVLLDSARVLATGTWRQRLMRLRFLLLFLLLVPIMGPIGWLCLALDRLIYPDFRDLEIREPLFLVGNHRVGSSWLQRTIGADTDHVTSFTLVDMIMPSILQRRALARIRQIDAAIGRPLGRLFTWIDDNSFNEYKKIHDMGWDKPEEDEFVLFHQMRSAGLWEAFPDTAAFRPWFWCDDEQDPEVLDRSLRFYRALVQRHLYVVGPDKLFLSKTPNFSMKVAGLQRVFPDARFIYLARDPMRVVPSTASLFHFAWWNTGARPHGQLDMDTILAICRAFYLDTPRRLDPSRSEVLRYEDLVADPLAAVTGLMERLGYTPSPSLIALLEREGRREYKRTHSYKLGEWGLSEAGLRESLSEVFAEYGYEEDAA